LKKDNYKLPPKMTNDSPQNHLDLIATVDKLNEDVKQLALNLALYLAKAKKDSHTISRLEPQFIRLVNSTIKVVQEIAIVVRAASNLEKVIYNPPSSTAIKDQIEVRLNSVLEQCSTILATLNKEGQPADWA
jgi:hypothetical protein